ncbi:MAG: helix-turn-helix domain-containing protein [Lactobacillus sp.]|jgi:transcriptional regulator with XRE-family HTH domain|nr:helix-turn-helix domain-containing protein [Lactobacillus sp.]MCI2033826.1 helix-turn-helix domain-containing protein [Lactobacillus sp.]
MLPERLRKLRTEKHFTQNQMADKLGITRPAYTAYESGKRQPDYDALKRLAAIFEVSTDYLLGNTDKPAPTTKEKKPDLADDDVILSFEGKPIPPEDLDVIRRFLRGGKRD